MEREFKKSKHKFSKTKRNEIRRNLYEIKNKRNLFTLGTENTEKNLDELESFLFKTKKYYDRDDVEYKGIKDIQGLFDLSIGDDYFKPTIVSSAFNNNYIQYESKEDKNKIFTVNEYLDMIRPYLVDMTNDHKTQSQWKIQLTMAINVISSKPDFDETRIMYAESNNVEIMIGSETNEVNKELFESLLQRYQKGLEESMKGREFVFDVVNALYYDFDKISLNRGKSYINSPKWLKNKMPTINPKNNDNKCFQYALTAALNYEKIERDHQRISKIKPFIDQYNWNGIDFPSQSKDWKKFESNNKSIALNILYIPHKIEEIRHA